MRHLQLHAVVVGLLLPATGALAMPQTFPGGVSWGENAPITAGCRVAKISRGLSHFVDVRVDGSLNCLGDETTCGTRPTLGNVVAVDCGLLHTIVLRSDGTIACWGFDTDGQCTVPKTATNASAIAAGDYFSSALTGNGSVVCWGEGASGTLTIPADLGTVTAIDAGELHMVARRSNGTVRCWGSNLNLQCNVPVGLSGVVAVSAGAQFTSALKSDGTVRCWGSNSDGQCSVPTNLGAITAIAAGSSHMVALRSDGTVRCWGNNSSGQSSPPTGLSGVAAISAEYSSSYAIFSSTPTDCNQNGVPDDCDIINGAEDCDGNGVPDTCEYGSNDCNQNGVPDAIDIANGTSRDANNTLKPDECEFPTVCASCKPIPVDLLLVADTSGSMTDLPVFCTEILGPVASTLRLEFDLSVQWFDLVLGQVYECATPDGRHFIPDNTPISACLGVTRSITTDEDWADGTVLVANPNFAHASIAWTPRNAVTVVLTLSDEGAEGGDPCDAEDDSAIANAIARSREWGVIHVPVAFPDSQACVYSDGAAPLGLMDRLAQGTGGAVVDARSLGFGSTGSSTDIIADLLAKIRSAVAASPRLWCPQDPCPADINGDCIVAAADITILLSAWGTGDPSADLNDDGIVNAQDIAILLGAWGPCLQ